MVYSLLATCEMSIVMHYPVERIAHTAFCIWSMVRCPNGQDSENGNLGPRHNRHKGARFFVGQRARLRKPGDRACAILQYK